MMMSKRHNPDDIIPPIAGDERLDETRAGVHTDATDATSDATIDNTTANTDTAAADGTASGATTADTSAVPSPSDDRQDIIAHAQRIQAEFDNYRKRVEREAQEQRAGATDNLFKALLPVIDTFELSLQHAKDDTGVVRGDDLYQGLLLLRDQLKHLLESQGLTAIDCSGLFNPRVHEVLMMVQQEGVPRGTIVEVLQPGYQRGGKIIRPAKVSVAK